MQQAAIGVSIAIPIGPGVTGFPAQRRTGQITIVVNQTNAAARRYRPIISVNGVERTSGDTRASHPRRHGGGVEVDRNQFGISAGAEHPSDGQGNQTSPSAHSRDSVAAKQG